MEYSEEEAAVKDHIEVALKQSSFAPWKSFLKGTNYVEEGSQAFLFLTFEPIRNFYLKL